MNEKMIVCGIVAVGPYNVIGVDGRLPWHSRQDFYHFKHMTMGFPCIFGKNTYENLPVKPLPGRLNIVCSSSYKIEKNGDVIRVPSLEEALRQCGNVKKVFICGGAFVYNYALKKDLIDIMYVTQIDLFDAQLKKQIESKKNTNTYFSHNFDNNNWRKEEIQYDADVLPKENQNIKALFYKYTRLR